MLVLRDPARARRARAAARRRRCSPRSAAASRRATARSCSPGSTSAATATATPATGCRGSSARSARRRGSQRLRLSSIEVNHLDDELVAALRETPAVWRHLHVPLQSGDDGVLRAMAPPLHGGHLPPPARARDGLQPDDGRDRRLPGRGRARVPPDARGRRRGRDHEGARLPVLAAPGHRGRRGRRPGAEARSSGSAAPRLAGALARACARALARQDRPGRTSSSSIARGAATATTTRRGSSTRRSASSCAVRGAAVTEEGILAAAASIRLHLLQDRPRRAAATIVHRADGFVAIEDIAPEGRRQLLVIPERHLETFRDVGRRSGAEEAKRMLDFVAGDGAAGRARRVPADGVRRRRARARPSSTSTGTSSAASVPGGCPHDADRRGIEDDLKEAMAARDDERRDALRLILKPARRPRRSSSGR